MTDTSVTEDDMDVIHFTDENIEQVGNSPLPAPTTEAHNNLQTQHVQAVHVSHDPDAQHEESTRAREAAEALKKEVEANITFARNIPDAYGENTVLQGTRKCKQVHTLAQEVDSTILAYTQEAPVWKTKAERLLRLLPVNSAVRRFAMEMMRGEELRELLKTPDGAELRQMINSWARTCIISARRIVWYKSAPWRLGEAETEKLNMLEPTAEYEPAEGLAPRYAIMIEEGSLLEISPSAVHSLTHYTHRALVQDPRRECVLDNTPLESVAVRGSAFERKQNGGEQDHTSALRRLPPRYLSSS
jgi:hypothetical protein